MVSTAIRKYGQGHNSQYRNSLQAGWSGIQILLMKLIFDFCNCYVNITESHPPTSG
jgi:hypothetical protein